MNVQDLVDAMQTIAPLEFAETWDRVGLLVGDFAREISGPVLLTIDLTEAVLDEAKSLKASAIMAYHPPIWEPLARLTTHSPRERILLRCIEAGISVYCPHTSLDAAPGGITDWLCEGLSGGGPGKIAGDCRALTPHAQRAAEREVKIVTFVTPDALDKVRSALASAGAGIIGAYSVCSFGAEGIGTFLGNETTSPAVGLPGQLERVREFRLEMVCTRRALPLAIETLRQFHPYEEPAVDVYELAPTLQRAAGAGRRLVLDRPATLTQLAQRLKGCLDHARVQVAAVGGPDHLDRTVTTLGVVPGAGTAQAAASRAEKCEVFITGEMKHHDVLEALHYGQNVILAGHTNTERGYLARLAGRLTELVPGMRTVLATADRDPLVIV